MESVTKLIDEAQIARRVDELAAEIAARSGGELHVIGVLKGAFVFLADLVRALSRAGVASRIDFLRLASYGAGKKSSGEVRLIGELPAGLAGRRVLVVDDIADSGRSLAHACRLIEAAGAADVRTCVLVDKPSRREVAVRLDFVGFTAPDTFVVGYGIDHAEDWRHLPYLGTVD